MKRGISLVELAQKIEVNKAAKHDYIADTRQLHLSAEGALVINGHGAARVNDTTHSQIAERIGIPAKYYNRLRTEAPQLLADNVNHWFQQKPERRMVRTLDGAARAFLSDRYRRFDNEDVAEVALPILAEIEGLEVVSSQITERRLYIKAVNHKVTGEVKVGDVVEAGLLISNSEIGLGALSVQRFVHRLVCLNGMVIPDGGLRAHHVGARASREESIYELLSDETLAADDKVIALKVRDVCRAALDEKAFNASLEKFRDASEQKIKGHPAKVVEVLGRKTGLNETEQGSVLRHLIEGGDLSKWGLANAVTRYAHEPDSYDRATDLEALGGKLIDLPTGEWHTIAEAA